MKLFCRSVLSFLLFPWSAYASDFGGGVEETKTCIERPSLSTFFFGQNSTDSLNPYPNLQKYIDASICARSGINPYTLEATSSHEYKQNCSFLKEQERINIRTLLDVCMQDQIRFLTSCANSHASFIPPEVTKARRRLARFLCCVPSYRKKIEQTDKERFRALQKYAQRKENVQYLHRRLTTDFIEMYAELQNTIEEHPHAQVKKEYILAPVNLHALKEHQTIIWVVFDPQTKQEIARISREYIFGNIPLK